MTVQFLVLGYTRDIMAAKGVEIALATKTLVNLQDSNKLRLQMVANWADLVDPEDRPYLEAVFLEILEEPADEAFEALSQLSAGCLRNNEEGICEEKDLRHVGPTLS